MNNQSNDEIDLIEILRNLKHYKKIILYTSIIFLVIGITVAIISPIKFSSSTIFIPQGQDTNSSLSGVASLVGLNLGSPANGVDIPLAMYPKIAESPKFKRQLLNQVIDQKDNLTLKNILAKHYNIKEDNELSKSLLEMTKFEEECFKILSEIISITINQKDGFITISSTMPVAEYAAVTTQISREILQNIIIENKIETARQNLNFSETQLNEKRLEFDNIQSKLAYFSDSNLNAVNSFVINEINKLEAEFEIINAVVTELSKQVEQAKLQVTKDTPVFSTIKEAIIPNQRSSPNRKRIVLTFVLVGFISSCMFVLILNPLKKIFQEL